MRCGRLHCSTPTEDVRQVKAMTLCVAHRLMAYGQLQPKSAIHRLTTEQKAERYRQIARRSKP